MITVRALIVTAVVAAAAACSSPAPASTSGAPPDAPAAPAAPVVRTAEQVVADLTTKVGTAKATIVYTAENDPNHLLGRPNGYTSKASFTDSRIKASEAKDNSAGAVDLGGSVEVYADEAGAAARKKYIDDLMKNAPILGSEYSYIAGPALLRVSQQLTPDQAAEYESALEAS